MNLEKADGKISEAAKTYVEASQEYCVLWGDLTINHWSSCMTKSEWAAWFQAFFAGFALILAVTLPFRERRNNRRDRIKRELEFARHWFERNGETLTGITLIVNVLADEVRDEVDEQQIAASISRFKDNYELMSLPSIEELHEIQSLSFWDSSFKKINSAGADFIFKYQSIRNTIKSLLLWRDRVISGVYEIPVQVGKSSVLKEIILKNLLNGSSSFSNSLDNFSMQLRSQSVPVGLEDNMILRWFKRKLVC